MKRGTADIYVAINNWNVKGYHPSYLDVAGTLWSRQLSGYYTSEDRQGSFRNETGLQVTHDSKSYSPHSLTITNDCQEELNRISV